MNPDLHVLFETASLKLGYLHSAHPVFFALLVHFKK